MNLFKPPRGYPEAYPRLSFFLGQCSSCSTATRMTCWRLNGRGAKEPDRSFRSEFRPTPGGQYNRYHGWVGKSPSGEPAGEARREATFFSTFWI